eukprot:5501478-Pyramimonas_sp.AAC.1
MRVTRGNELADGCAQRGAEIAANCIAPQVAALNEREKLLKRIHRRIGAVAAHFAGLDHPRLSRTRQWGGG